MEILETPTGRASLRRLGLLIVQEWHGGRRHRFGGDVRHMSAYVDHFLSALRADFPNIVIDNLGGPDVLAQTRRVDGGPWNGDLLHYKPKSAIGLFYNYRVSLLRAYCIGALANIICSELLIWLVLLQRCGRLLATVEEYAMSELGC